ncbi:hypothetical protein [Methylobacterium brachiatum]
MRMTFSGSTAPHQRCVMNISGSAHVKHGPRDDECASHDLSYIDNHIAKYDTSALQCPSKTLSI